MRELRSSLAGRKNANDRLDLFDELVTEQEFGLALHEVCDYPLEQGSPRPETTVIEGIQAPHESMKLEDDCVHRLRQKARP